MSGSNTAPITQLLKDYANGACCSLDAVVEVVYGELRTIARQQLRRSSAGLETTALVHEAYEKLLLGQTQTVHDRRHFFAIAARAMRQIVVDTYRAENAAKRGDGAMAVTLAEQDFLNADDPVELTAVHEALETLAQRDSELAETVDLACFAGLSTEEIADLQDTTVRTVQRRLARARAWLGELMAG